MSAKSFIPRRDFLRIKRALDMAQYHAGALCRAKRTLKEILPPQSGAWANIDLAVIAAESPRALISRFGLRVKTK